MAGLMSTTAQMKVIGCALTALFVAAIAIALTTTVRGAADEPSRRDAEQLLLKIDSINRNALAERPAARRTPITEQELNAYLQFVAKDQIPAGLEEPWVGILGDGRLAGKAIVDLDAVSRQRSSGRLFDPLSYLGGRLPVTATGVLKTSNGVGQFELESAEVSGVSVPKALLQRLVSYYSRSTDAPDGVSLDSPFELPARIRQIDVEKGQAIIVQ